MANYCSVEYVFEGSREILEDFRNRLKTYTSKGCSKSVDYPHWETNVAAGFEIDYEAENISCRGEIVFIGFVEYDDKTNTAVLPIDAEDAWAPNNALFDAIIQKCYHGEITYEMFAKEPGMDLYINTDVEGKYFPERYGIQVDNGSDIIEKSFSSIEEMRKFILLFLGVRIFPFTSFEDMEKALEDKFEWAHIFEYASE